MLHKLNFNYNMSSQKFQESEAQEKNLLRKQTK